MASREEALARAVGEPSAVGDPGAVGDSWVESARPLRVEPAALVLEYRLEEQVRLDVAPAYRHVERWSASVRVNGSGDDRGVEIGYAHVLVFNLEAGADIRDFADPTSGTWIDVDRGPGQAVQPDEPDIDEDPGGHVLLLDRVWLHPDYRGQGLGPIVAAAVIERLGRGCHVAACYPAPFEDAVQQPDDRERAIEALGKLWSKVGFSHWDDGVWMLDLHADDIHATLTELLAARTQGRPLSMKVPEAV
jgi:GNAT superfamily N-acetyltransferase